jgi:hypothetical protein
LIFGGVIEHACVAEEGEEIEKKVVYDSNLEINYLQV